MRIHRPCSAELSLSALEGRRRISRWAHRGELSHHTIALRKLRMPFSRGSNATSGAQPFFDYYGAPQSYLEILRSGLTGRLTDRHTDREKLQAELGKFLGVEGALCLPQARLGLYIALLQFLTPEKHKVILSPYTIYDVVNVVIAAGGTPVFADIDEVTCNIDFHSVARLIDDDTGAVIVTHLHGLACDMSAFAFFCQEKGIPLLEDSAQAFGGIVNGRRLGTIGDAGVYSFSMKKHVNCLYGGCLVVNNANVQRECQDFLTALPEERGRKLIKRAFLSLFVDLAHSQPLFRELTFPLLRWRVKRSDEKSLGAVAYEHNPVRRDELPQQYLCQMTPRQASVVSRQLADVDRQTGIRIDYAREYHAMLGDLPGIRLPPLREDSSHVYLSFAVQVPERLRFQREAMARDCDVRLQSLTNLANSPSYTDFASDCPNAEKVAGQVALLPIHPRLGMAEIRRIGEVVRALMR